MARFSKARRQEIVDGYLNDSGRNRFVPGDFLEWLRERPDHEAHSLFFGIDDVDAAQAYRRRLVRRWVSGLRVTVTVTPAVRRVVGKVTVRKADIPLMFSPGADRKGGGGYLSADMTDPTHFAELRRQAAKALAAWIERHGGVAELAGLDVGPVRELAGALEGARVEAAA